MNRHFRVTLSTGVLVLLLGNLAHALSLVGVQSRKVHAAAGEFNVAIDITQSISAAPTTESRKIGSAHMIVFQFDVPINAAGTLIATDENGAAVSASATPAGNSVEVTLTGVPDRKRVTVSLTNVNGAGFDVSAAIGLLVGDANNSREITITDLSAVKARSGQAADASNFKYDFDVSGLVTASDILAVKNRPGQTLPPALTIGGNVSGLAGNVVLQQGSYTLRVAANGAFTFPHAVADGSLYNVSVLTPPPDQNCTVTNGSGMVAGAGITNIAVQCSPLPNIAFVTSTTHTGNLGGVVGADTICQSRAAAAGLSGSYYAWISSTTINAASRFGTSRGWVRLDGKPFADTVADLTAGKIFYPLRLNESGVDVMGDATVFTGTQANGTLFSGQSCTDWTSNSAGVPVAGGLTGAGAPSWTIAATFPCNASQHLYCLGRGRISTLSVVAQTGRLAFATTANYAVGGGIASADALCQSEATAAGKAGTFKALLATSTASAASRFNTNGPTWVRADGVPLVNAAPDIAAPTLVAPLNVSASGAYLAIHAAAWTGAAGFSTVGTATSTCNEWTSTASGSASAAYIDRSGSGSLFTVTPCSSLGRLFCLQE